MKLFKFAFVLALFVCLSVNSTQATLIVHYSFDDGTVTDLSGNSLHGNLVGTATIVDDAVRGSKVLELDGTRTNGGRVEISDSFAFLDFSTNGVPGAGTLAAWINAATESADSKHQCVFSQGGISKSGGQGLGAFVRRDASRGVWVNSGTHLNTNDEVPREEWVHLAISYYADGTTKVYHNGTEVSGYTPEDGNRGGPITAPVAANMIGADQYLPTNPGAIFDGRIDDFRLYDEALSQSDIRAIIPVLDIPGDADEDGDVDAADAQAVAQNWGSGTSEDPATWAEGNFDGDNVVGPKDAAILAANFGYTTPTESVASVPEPSALALLLAVVLAVAVRRAR